ncbi:hypothetical protein [Streptomyces lavendulocolor]|uniref:hypothetical protein n=1 Tax=Streptomyces lavendulocolor TaxID=67316 RepID=UPI003C2D23FF
MPFEDDVSEAMHRTGETFSTDHRAIVEGGLRRGRTRVVRRRAGAAAVAVVALTGAALYAQQLLGPSTGLATTADTSRSPSPDGTAPTPPAPSRGVTFTGGPTPAVDDPDTHIRVSADQMIQILERVLPKGELTRQRGTSNFGDPARAATASLVYDDGFGKAFVEVSIKRADREDPATRALVVCPVKVTPPALSCRDETGAAGGNATVLSQDKGLRKSRTLSLSPEGYLVELTAFNGVPNEGGPTRTNTPFTPMQTSHLTGTLNSAMTRYGIPNADLFTREVHVAGGLDVMERLQRLAPAGLSPRGGGGDGATGYILAYDVKNKTKSHLRAALTPKGAAGPEPRWTRTLPDGTKIATSERPAKGKGVTEWRVDALRPSGLRVTITSYNAEYPHKDANRTTPPATPEQLQAVAVHDSWLTLK